MSESNSITHVRFGAIVNSLIEGQNMLVAKAFDRAFRELQTKIEEQQDIIEATPTPPPASEISSALSQEIIHLVISINHCLSDVIERVENRDQDMIVPLAVMTK